jgi:hypothetical protein
MQARSPATSSSRGNGAEWVRLRPIGYGGVARGCTALGCVGLAAVLFATGIVVAVFGGSNAGAAVIVALSLATGGVGGWKLLGAVGPRPRVWAHPIQVEAGKTLKVRWEVIRRFKQARSIRITWEGQESAIERGYDGGIYRSIFSTRVITSEIGPLDGTASLELPEVMMPSFVVRNSRIEWLIRARVLTQGWPDVEEAYLIDVLPNLAVRS